LFSLVIANYKLTERVYAAGLSTAEITALGLRVQLVMMKPWRTA
jgi:hypothetical protein